VPVDIENRLVSDLPGIEGHAKAPGRDNAAAERNQMVLSAGPNPHPAGRPSHVVSEHLIHDSDRLTI
jgi:hypothetical protein